MSQKPIVITDFDGVVGDTAEMNWTLVQYLHKEVKKEHYLIDHHLGNVYEQPVVPFTEHSSSLYDELYNTHLSIEHLKKAVPAVRVLSEDYNLQIVTSNYEAAIERVLTDAGIADCFTSILGKYTHRSKQEKFKSVFKTHNVTAADSLYITDTVGDLKEAQAVGLRTIAVTFGYHPRKLLLEHHPTTTADTWDEVVTEVNRLMRSDTTNTNTV